MTVIENQLKRDISQQR